MWKFDASTDFFWNVYGKLELVKVKNVHPQVTVFCEVFYQEAQIIFLLNFLISQWETLYFKTKAELAENNDALAFWEGEKKLSQPCEPP